MFYLFIYLSTSTTLHNPYGTNQAKKPNLMLKIRRNKKKTHENKKFIKLGVD